MTTRYSVEFTGWLRVNSSTPEEAYDIAKRTLADAGVQIMIEDIEEVHW